MKCNQKNISKRKHKSPKELGYLRDELKPQFLGAMKPYRENGDHFAKNMLCNSWLAFGSHNRQYVATVSTYKINVKCLNVFVMLMANNFFFMFLC